MGRLSPCRALLAGAARGVQAFEGRHGRLPRRLDEVGVPPRCPLTGLDFGYEAGEGGFTVYCRGWAHRRWLGRNNPGHTEAGRVDRTPHPPPTPAEERAVAAADDLVALKLLATSPVTWLAGSLVLLSATTTPPWSTARSARSRSRRSPRRSAAGSPDRPSS